ncbi:hypothetical protein ZIOFF_011774 [Zingiber officinale]|uniref:Uncharacterized protein n=1 Tax=Zingiber officinale TaxID=94328 RepID=A0A8J5I6D0_ZINOF|nr:hypothetical protein ZIOFF_011774 [Zingiber officinale]
MIAKGLRPIFLGLLLCAPIAARSLYNGYFAPLEIYKHLGHHDVIGNDLQLRDIKLCTFYVELDLQKAYPTRGSDLSTWEIMTFAENLLVTKDLVKIAYFGLAREVHSKSPFIEYVSTRWH